MINKKAKARRKEQEFVDWFSQGDEIQNLSDVGKTELIWAIIGSLKQVKSFSTLVKDIVEYDKVCKEEFRLDRVLSKQENQSKISNVNLG